MVDNELIRSIIYFYLCGITFITKVIYFQLSIQINIPIRYSTTIVQLLKGNLTVGKYFVRGYKFQYSICIQVYKTTKIMTTNYCL